EQLYIPVKVPRCDVFWSPHINVPLLPVLTKKRLVTIHDMFHASEMHNMSRIKKAYTRIILNSLNIYKPEVITVSEFSKSEILRYTRIPSTKITVAYNGYDAQKFRLDSKHITNLQVPFVLYVGNVKPHKNLNLVVEAFKILKNEHRFNVNLKIVGKKEGFITGDETVAKNIAAYGLEDEIHFTGRINDKELIETYQQASLLIFPSKYEGFGLPPLEAMACGCPSIVSDIPVFRELYGKSVLYTPTEDPTVLAQNIKDAINNPNVLSALKSSFPDILNTYSWEKSQEVHLKVLDNIFNKAKI
ncbi:MAG TPA: glycosyltransferase family 1 protein, partial [Cytophagales bacterium]|nr:glycosyltransferase family 1 protein [Cytophagales bacterium]